MFEPGADAFQGAGHQFRFFADEQQQAAEGRAGHQVLICTGAPDRVRIALMRHELEHVRQFEQNLYIMRAAEILSRTFELLAPELEGAYRGVYPYLPFEQDASARGTELARTSFGAPPMGLLAGPHASLLDTPAMSGAIDTLPTRLIGMLAIFPNDASEVVVERYPGAGSEPMAGLVALVDGLVPDLGAEILAACIMDPEITQVRERLPAVIVSSWSAALMGHSRSYESVGRAFAIAQRRAVLLATDPEARDQNLLQIQGTP